MFCQIGSEGSGGGSRRGILDHADAGGEHPRPHVALSLLRFRAEHIAAVCAELLQEARQSSLVRHHTTQRVRVGRRNDEIGDPSGHDLQRKVPVQIRGVQPDG